MAQDFYSQEIGNASAPVDYYSKEIKGTTGSWEPNFTTGNKAIDQYVVNPLAQAGNAILPAIRGVEKGFGFPTGGEKNIPTPDMTNAPLPAKVLGDVAGGLGYGLGAATISRNPLMAMGGMGSLSAAGQGQNPVMGAIEGVGQGAAQGLAGLAGSKMVQGIAKPLSNAASNFSDAASKMIMKYAPNVGTALGMGGAGAIMAPPGQRIEGAATGATFGSMNPIGGPKFITSDEYNNIHLSKAGDDILKVLNAGKSVYKDFDKRGNDVNEAAQMIAHNRIIIDRTADGNIDTTAGQEQLLNATKPYAQQLQQMLGTNKSTIPGQGGFDLEDLRKQGYNAIPNHPAFQDAVSRQAARAQVDKFIDAEIAEPGRGRYVNGQTLDDIKGGWWKVRYDLNNQAAKPVGGLLGNIAKTQIENAYPDQAIQQTNNAQAKLLNAYHLLDLTNNNKIKGGRLGNIASSIIGTGIGLGAGKAIPIPGIGEMIGGGIGGVVGHEVSKFVNDPKRITTDIAKRLDNLKIINPSGLNEGSSVRRGVVIPDLMNQRNIPIPQDLGISQNPVIGLPSPRNVAYVPSGVQPNINAGAIKMPNTGGGSPIEVPPLSRKLRGAYTPGQTQVPFGQNPVNPLAKPSPIQQGGSVLGGSQNPLHNLSPEQLKAAEKAIKIEKIIRS